MNKTLPHICALIFSVMIASESEAASIRFDGGSSGMGTDYNTAVN